MNFEIQKRSLSTVIRDNLDTLLVLWPADDKALLEGKDPVVSCVQSALRHGDFERKPGAILSLYAPSGVKARHVVVVCSGEGTSAHVRTAVSAAWAALKSTPSQRLGIHVASALDPAQLLVIVMAIGDATYNYTTTLTQAKARQLSHVVVSTELVNAPLREALVQAGATMAGVEVAKEWGNRPANHATPTDLAQAAKSLAKGALFKCEVLGHKEASKLGMGAFLAVAQGAAQAPKFIVMRYNGAASSQAPVVLIGKGITFDTGGISLKPAAEMDEMKYDMCGAASVLGVFKALGEIKPAINVVGIIPATENMPDGLAVKPGDVVTSMSGQTIEILNTDAEGRLVLCDALTYAERFKPQAVIDIATLTGACVIALGGVRSGLFTNDDVLAKSLQAAGEAAGDPCWRMPLDDEYAEGLKSKFADVANVAGRQAGAVTAAKFLQRFAKRLTWAHLDIAGTAWRSGAAKGATGRPVGLLLTYLLAQAASSSGSPTTVVRKSRPRG